MPRLTEAVAPRYRVVRFIDEGGMGCVFEGEDVSLGKRVALKVLAADLASASAIERFHREKRVHARLSHSHIVPLFNFIETPDLLIQVMDFMEGETLHQALARGPMPVERVARIGAQLLSALELAHRHGIVHRDIKPANVFLRGDHAMLGDFGIAVESNHDEVPLTEPRGLLGTIGYMPPEQLKGLVVDGRTDLFALGIVLRECLTGQRPVTDSGEVAPWRGVPPVVRPVLERALKDDPAERWPEAAAFREAWETAVRGGPATRRARGVWTVAPWLAALVVLVAAAWHYRCQLLPGVTSCRVSPMADLAIMPFKGNADPGAGPPLSRLMESIGWLTPISVAPMSRTEAWWDSVGAKAQNQVPPFGRLYTDGWLAMAGGRLTAEVMVRDRNEQAVASVRLSADTSQRQELARALSDSIVCKVFSERCADIRMAFRRTDPATLDLFFAGKDSIAVGNWDAGERNYRLALSHDRFFMPAAWELMMALRFQRKPHQQLLTYINTWRDSLPEFYARLTAAAATPDLRDRLRLMQGVVEDYPRSGTALLLYGNELFHRGALAGRGLPSTVDSLRAWATREGAMNQASTWDLVWWGNLRLGDRPAAVRALRARQALDLPASDTYDRFQWIGINARFQPLVASLKNWLLGRSATDSLRKQVQQYMRLSSLMDVPQEQVVLGRLLASGKDPVEALTGAVGITVADAMLGRPGQAVASLDSLASSQPPEFLLQSHEWPVHLFTLGLYHDTARVTTALAWLTSTELTGSAAVRAQYALARFALASGDLAQASAIAARLRVMAGTLATAGRHATLIEAELAAAEGAPDRALQLSEVIYLRDTSEVRLAPFARATTYLDRARWQLARSDVAAADRELTWYENADFEGWLTGAPQEGEVDAVLSVYARLLRGELSSPGAGMCRGLDRVLELWKPGEIEPVTEPLRDRAVAARAARQCH